MYPNPQDALPLPPRANLEWYRNQARELLHAARETDSPTAVSDWAGCFFDEAVAASQGVAISERDREHYSSQLAEFARRRLGGSNGKLTQAHFVLARALGFASWTRLQEHVRAQANASPSSVFEHAAEAVIRGDEETLRRLLRDNPGLSRARSTREHRATLLHYVSANGVESFRQRTPANAVDIARLLLDAGAEVDAEADVYGGGATTLGLVATSVHPEKAGVQLAIIDLLLERGARLDGKRPAGNNHGIVVGCLANGQPKAAAYLASRGAWLNLEGAAGIGRLNAVRQFVDIDGTLHDATEAQLVSGFALACAYGHAEVVSYLLDAGLDPDTRLSLSGTGHTALHLAANHANVEIARDLLRRGASVDETDDTWGTPPLLWALHGWSREKKAPPERYVALVRTLVAAGAVVPARVLQDAHVRSDAEMLAALVGESRG